MLKPYKNYVALFVVLALVFIIVNQATDSNRPDGTLSVFDILSFVMIILGCWALAKSKGYPSAWGLLGLLHFLGMIILALFFADKTHTESEERSHTSELTTEDELEYKLKSNEGDGVITRMNKLNSDELRTIYINNNHQKWTEEVFDTIEHILEERGENIPDQSERRFAVFTVKDNKMSEIDADKRIWKNLKMDKHDFEMAKFLDKEKLEDMKDCRVSEEGFPVFECSQCSTIYGLDLSVILPEKDLKSRGLIFTGESEELPGQGCVFSANFAAFFLAALFGSLIGYLIKSPPFVYAIIAVILFAFIKPVVVFVFSKINIGKRKIDYWLFKCPNCSNRMIIFTDGKSAGYI